MKCSISDLSDRLQAEVPSEVRDTSYRDERMSKATEKKENLEADVANMKFDAGAGEDPFMKVKGLVTGLISRLRDESSSQGNQKAYCDEEMSKLTEKEDLKADTGMHSSKLETAMFRSTTLNGEISALQSELDALSKWPLQMDTMRADEGHISAKAKADLTGEITAAGKVHHETVVRGVVQNLGIDSFINDLSSVDSKRSNYQEC